MEPDPICDALRVGIAANASLPEDLLPDYRVLSASLIGDVLVLALLGFSSERPTGRVRNGW